MSGGSGGGCLRPETRARANDRCHTTHRRACIHTMKHQLLPPTGLLFSSLAVLSLSVMADDSPTSEKPEKESGKAADNGAENERDLAG